MKKFKSVMIIILVSLISGLVRQEQLFAQEQAQQSGQQEQQGKSGQPPAQDSANAQAAVKPGEINKVLTPVAPVLEIKRLESDNPLYSIELRDVQLTDLFRVIAHDYNLNILMDKSVSGTITASFTNISLEEALGAIAELSNLAIEKKGNIIKVSPNLVTRTVVLKYIEAKKFMESVSPVAAGAAAAGSAPAQASNILGLLSDKGKILVGQQQNSLTVIDYPDNVRNVEDYLKVVDHKMESRVFKLKYLKADEVVGVTTKTTTTTQSITPTGTQVSTTTSTNTASGSAKKGN